MNFTYTTRRDSVININVKEKVNVYLFENACAEVYTNNDRYRCIDNKYANGKTAMYII